MSDSCNSFFLTATAKEIWAKQDEAGEKKMFEYLYNARKKDFFKRVIFRNGIIHEAILTELAENAFVASWEAFNKKGRSGNMAIEQETYTGYFFQVFKNHYLRALENETKKERKKKMYGSSQSQTVIPDTDFKQTYSWRTQKVLDQISSGCRDLLQWRYVEELSYDEIAVKKNISRKSAIHMVWRCGEGFIVKYRNGG